MAVTAAYATAQQYRNVTGKTDMADDAEILTDLTAVSRYLEGRLGRHFTKDVSAVKRIYLPEENVTALRVDDMAEAPTSITLDTGGDGQYATVLESADYELLPFNADKGPEPRPYTKIRMLNGVFYKNVRVKVKAKFGWPDVPTAIERATIQITAILRLESPRATRRISELGEAIDASQDAQSIVRQLTDSYKRVRYI